MHDKANCTWTINYNPNGTVPIQDAQLAVLMDIRDELKKLNLLLHCPRFTFIPHTLDAIKKNTTKKRIKKTPRKEIVYGKANRKSTRR